MRPSGEPVTFRTRHLVALRKLARARATTVSKMMAVEADKLVLHDSRAEIEDALNAIMNEVGALAWTQLDTPERQAVIDRLTASLNRFEEALDRAGL